jgi:hypothetical protein
MHMAETQSATDMMHAAETATAQPATEDPAMMDAHATEAAMETMHMTETEAAMGTAVAPCAP